MLLVFGHGILSGTQDGVGLQLQSACQPAPRRGKLRGAIRMQTQQGSNEPLAEFAHHADLSMAVSLWRSPQSLCPLSRGAVRDTLLILQRVGDSQAEPAP